MKQKPQIVFWPWLLVFVVVSACGRTPADNLPAAQAEIADTLIQFSTALAE